MCWWWLYCVWGTLLSSMTQNNHKILNEIPYIPPNRPCKSLWHLVVTITIRGEVPYRLSCHSWRGVSCCFMCQENWEFVISPAQAHTCLLFQLSNPFNLFDWIFSPLLPTHLSFLLPPVFAFSIVNCIFWLLYSIIAEMFIWVRNCNYFCPI